jgi:hypothetical protein
MTEDKISVKDLRAHAQVLLELKMMPSLEQLLTAIAETHRKIQGNDPDDRTKRRDIGIPTEGLRSTAPNLG